MAIPITVPRLGWTMEEGVFLGWRKQEGEPVRPGEVLFELEGDKAAQDVEALDGGVLRIPPDAPRSGATVAVGAVLGYLLAPGETPPWEGPAAQDARAGAEDRLQAPAEAPRASQPASVAVADDAEALPAISPRARRVARELGVEWKQLRGSGRTGRIRERDVRAAVGTGRVLPITPVRRAIAERLVAGVRATAPVTLTTRADATNLVNLRNQFKSAAARGAVVPGYTDFLVKLTAAALREHPLLNARWAEDGIHLLEAIHIAVAVDTEAGLLAPVVHDVPALSLRQVAMRCHELIEQARARRLTAAQMQGGTFTITNLGQYGVDAFTPILNPPQCAILGLGRIRPEPAVQEDRVLVCDVLTLSLTFDHRVVDGAPAVRFLDTVRRFVEQPGPYLIE